MLLRNYEEADASYQQSLELSPDMTTTYSERLRNTLMWKGDLASSRVILAEAERQGKEGDTQRILATMRWRILMDEGDYQAAENVVKSLRGDDVGDELFQSQFLYTPVTQMLGECEMLKGNTPKARQYYDSARVQIERRIQSAPDDARLYSALGLAYAGLGRNAEAVTAGLRGVDMLPVEKEAWRGSFRLTDLAQIYAMTGEQDKAVDVLQRLLSIPAEISRVSLKMEPRWKPLHGNKRFQQLVAG